MLVQLLNVNRKFTKANQQALNMIRDAVIKFKNQGRGLFNVFLVIYIHTVVDRQAKEL